MAYASLFSLAQTIDQILNHDHCPISVDGKRRLTSTHEHVIFLQEFLENFPKEADGLERRIRDAANEAEDIIEHFMYEQIRSYHKLIGSTSAGRAIVKSTQHNYDFSELRKVREEIEEIYSLVREVKEIKSSFTNEDMQFGDSPAGPSSSSILAPAGNNIVVGFDEDLFKMKDLLCGESFKREVIPIVGMGGIGKTTLARNAYLDPLIMERFEIRAWSTASQDYKTQNILSNLLASMKELNRERSKQSNTESMEERVYKILKGRRYLIVLDDMWSVEAWDNIRNIFPDDNNGSRVMLTTRLWDVASYPDSSIPPHQMRFMEEDQSWNLLREKVFSSQGCPPELENTGKDIARSCGGLPLAIVLIAGVLSSVGKTQASWKEIAKNVHSAFNTEGGQLEKIISLSYTHLPHHLRPCFLYMGGFPEDYEIHVSKLKKLWIAEGFVKTIVSKSFEEVAEGYLEDLVKRSLALVTRKKSNGKIKSCSIHDLVRDLCKRKAQDENFQRRLSIGHPDLMCLAKTHGSTIRSVICFQPSESSLGFLRKFRLLRVLDVVDSNIYSLPAQVFELFHLRYLAFGCPMEIPAAISRLQNLHTLIICPRKRSRRYTMDEIYLPLEIWMMPLLRHLVSFFDLLPKPEGTAFSLGELQTLSVVKKFICTKRILEMIPNLKKLGITYFGDKYSEDYQLHNLVYLHQLEKLKLIMKADSLVWLKINPVFPEMLKKLTLSGWRLPWEYMETVGKFPNLQVLKLRDHACEGDTWETTEEQFPRLEFLLIDGSDIQNWETESSHFPRLKCLILYRCSLLNEIPVGIGEISTLELIEVDYGNESLVESAKHIQEEQQSYGNDAFQVHCVHDQVINLVGSEQAVMTQMSFREPKDTASKEHLFCCCVYLSELFNLCSNFI